MCVNEMAPSGTVRLQEVNDKEVGGVKVHSLTARKETHWKTKENINGYVEKESIEVFYCGMQEVCTPI